ncbi:hypothetical protein DFQ11_10620 [Winogradskyella epiphytica]|uniref:NAD glycohydrolase translocation F5/8 type C domain-containing protein n=1 Tax=Winogradskyella epiphytica TaxID=262005 RepID=A0A2V4XX52_9FLAO|nr:hypothetical protein [Winogradskyella epiphytica]PYE80223.1 hypothetical protein DFQ11_10620 [Winogradskyella epiphytica]GGW69863.1 hypothetical protein GCM10008085_22250 [Winogradskyella epiphytica]
MKKVKYTINIIIIFLSINVNSQVLEQIKTQVRYELDFGEQVQNDWIKIKKFLSENEDWNNFTKEEIELIDKYDAEVVEDMWDILGGGCSFYCGAGEYEVMTSSNLAEQNGIGYSSKNLRDFSYETAWVEGVKGYGIGETIEFEFSATHPRLTEIIIVNGYVKSKSVWKNNSRVKTLKMYLNSKPYGIIELKDVYAEQSFKVEPIGHADRENGEELIEKGTFKITFEILNVYKGDKYDDTAITEIYFDGIDVH